MIFRDLSYKVLEQSKIVHAITENHNRRSLLITSCRSLQCCKQGKTDVKHLTVL